MTTDQIGDLKRVPLSLGQRLGVGVGMLYSKLAYGDPAGDFVEEMIRALGFKGFLDWSKMAGTTLQALEERYGPAIAQLLTAIVAMWNGCTYCSKGHTLAANVHHHKATGELLPLDEEYVYWLQRLRDEEVMQKLSAWFAGEEHARTRQLLERLYQIKTGTAEGDTDDDPYLRAINGAWDWATQCTIMVDVIEVPPLAPIGKDRAAVAAYRDARAEWRKNSPEFPSEAERRSWKRDS